MSVSKITNTAVLTTSNETLGLITASSGVIIPGLELVLEHFFSQICDSNSNSGSNRSLNQFQSGIDSTTGTCSKA